MAVEGHFPTRSFTSTGGMGQDRYGHTATLLMDGRVLVTAGHSNSSQYTAELYGPGE